MFCWLYLLFQCTTVHRTTHICILCTHFGSASNLYSKLANSCYILCMVCLARQKLRFSCIFLSLRVMCVLMQTYTHTHAHTYTSKKAHRIKRTYIPYHSIPFNFIPTWMRTHFRKYLFANQVEVRIWNIYVRNGLKLKYYICTMYDVPSTYCVIESVGLSVCSVGYMYTLMRWSGCIWICTYLCVWLLWLRWICLAQPICLMANGCTLARFACAFQCSKISLRQWKIVLWCGVCVLCAFFFSLLHMILPYFIHPYTYMSLHTLSTHSSYIYIIAFS